MKQFEYFPSDNDLENIVNGVVDSSYGTKRNSARLTLLCLGLVAVGALAAYVLMENPIKSKQKKDS